MTPSVVSELHVGTQCQENKIWKNAEVNKQIIGLTAQKHVKHNQIDDLESKFWKSFLVFLFSCLSYTNQTNTMHPARWSAQQYHHFQTKISKTYVIKKMLYEHFRFMKILKYIFFWKFMFRIWMYWIRATPEFDQPLQNAFIPTRTDITISVIIKRWCYFAVAQIRI